MARSPATSSTAATVARHGDNAVRPKVSLIVCTRNRSARLPQFFAHLAQLDFANDAWELVIVDHASSDRTPQAIEEFAATTPIALCHVRALTDALTGAKNIGLTYARGEILALTDDDCYLRPDYLRALTGVFAEHDVGVVGGRVVLHDPTDARLSIRDVDTPTEIAPHTFVRAGTIHGANMAIRRDVVRAVGGFDPLFGPGTRSLAAEDVEYVARAVWAGWRARYDPRPVVAHHHGRKPGDDTERYRRSYDYGRGAYYTKYILVPRARRVYLRAWIELTRRAPRSVRRSRLARELAGGQRYLFERLMRPRAIPQLPATPACSPTTVPSV
jgi:glycosyltransferase involved in cell wall biosynthesis